MKTYLFKAVLEKDRWPDEPDAKTVWRAYFPRWNIEGLRVGDIPRKRR